jgi:hypothetical protein
MTLDTQGRPILLVHLRAKSGVEKAFRFLLDTGCAVSLIHTDIAKEFVNQDRTRKCHITDAAGKDITSAVGEIEIQVGGLRGLIFATRLDLDQTRKYEDEPIEGVLGMNFLVHTRFILDPAHGTATWNPVSDLSGTMVPLAFSPEKLPTLTIQVGSQPTLAILDSGSSSAVSLPKGLAPSWGGTEIETVGGFGGIDQGISAVVPQVTLSGSAHWNNVETTFWSRQKASLGAPALLASPVEFDFLAGRIIFAGSGQLSYTRRPIEIPVCWHREKGKAYLQVTAVGRGSLLERSGAVVGDRVVKVGGLEGSRLTRKALLDLLESNPEPRFVFVHQSKSAGRS